MSHRQRLKESSSGWYTTASYCQLEENERLQGLPSNFLHLTGPLAPKYNFAYYALGPVTWEDMLTFKKFL